MNRRRWDWAFIPPARANVFVIVARWRYEIALAMAVPLMIRGLVEMLGPVWTSVDLSIVTAAIAVCRQTREYCVDRTWCLVTPHRVRVGCAYASIYGWRGKIPFVYRATREPWGERVRVWCRAGTSVEDSLAAEDQLAAACWAAFVVIGCDPDRSQRVTVDVVRYPQLWTGP